MDLAIVDGPKDPPSDAQPAMPAIMTSNLF